MALRVYYFFAFGAMGLYLPFFPVWLRARGFVGAEMSALVVLLPVCQLASPTIVGILADKWGLRGRMMSYCAITTALGVSLLAWGAQHFEAIPFVFAFGSILLFASLRSPMVGLADVLALEVAPNYGRMRLWGSLGFMCAAFLGGRVVDPKHAFQVPLAVSVVVWGVSLISWLLPKTSHLPPRPALKDAKELLGQKAYRRLLVTMMFIFGGMTAYDLCSSLRLDDLGASPAQVGVFWTIATSAEIVLMFWAAPFLDRLGPGKLLTVACICSSGRWLFLSQATSLPLILWLQPLHAVSFGLMWVSAIGVLKREVGKKGLATAQGLYGSSIATGAIFGLTTWGIVYEHFGSQVVFVGASVSSALAALQASRLIRLTPGTSQKPALSRQQ